VPVFSAFVTTLGLLFARRQHGTYCGSLARSLIPVFAATMLVLCLTARPYLVWRERHWLAQDRILAVGPHEVGISRLENQGHRPPQERRQRSLRRDG